MIMVVRSQECGLIFLHKKWVDASPSTLTTSQKSIKGDSCNKHIIAYPGASVNVFLSDVFLSLGAVKIFNVTDLIPPCLCSKNPKIDLKKFLAFAPDFVRFYSFLSISA